MSVQFDQSRNRWVVRWYEDGRHRSRRFDSEAEARKFEAERASAASRTREAVTAGVQQELFALRARLAGVEEQLGANARASSVYPYATRQGIRWRIAVETVDGSATTRRGFATQEAALHARERLADASAFAQDISFGTFWHEWLSDKTPYLSEGALEDLQAHGRKRLLPHLGERSVCAVTEADIRSWIAVMLQLRDQGQLATKTINNARAALSSALAEATRRGLLERNPCRAVPPLPADHAELDYLHPDEIDRYLDACSIHYRPLAELLIGTGARISEALAVTWPDVDLDRGVVRIQRQRARHGHGSTRPKGKRARSVLIGPRLTRTLRQHRDASRPAAGEPEWLFICPRPARGRYARRPASRPPSRKNVHEWHEHALEAAGLRDMPLHALRHTAAATWLSTGNSLIFVARQLGHRSITTTEHHYGHLEQA